jgi:hypothetical protein
VAFCPELQHSAGSSCQKRSTAQDPANVPRFGVQALQRRSSGRLSTTKVRWDPRGACVARYYDPATGELLSLDPDVALTEAPFNYAGDDPVNLIDPSGLNDCGIWSWVCDIGHVAAGTPRDVGVAIRIAVNPTGCELGHNPDGSCTGANYWRDYVDIYQDAYYLVYWGSYELIGGLEKLGSYLPGSRLLNLGSVVGTGFILPELVGLAGQGLGSLAKGQTVWLEGKGGQPLLGNEVLGPFHGRQVTRELGLPFLTFPGFDAHTHQAQLRW